MLVFQQGHLESLLGFHSIGGVTAWLPQLGREAPPTPVPEPRIPVRV